MKSNMAFREITCYRKLTSQEAISGFAVAKDFSVRRNWGSEIKTIDSPFNSGRMEKNSIEVKGKK